MKNLVTVTVINYRHDEQQKVGFFLDPNTFVAIPNHTDGVFERYFVPSTDEDLATIVNSFVPYVTAIQDDRKRKLHYVERKMVEKRLRELYLPDNHTYEKIMEMSRVVRNAIYVDSDHLNMTDEYYYKTQRENYDINAYMTSSKSILLKTNDIDEVIPIEYKSDSIYECNRAYPVANLDYSSVMAISISNVNWGFLDDYQINEIYKNYLKGLNAQKQRIKIR